MKHPNSAHPDSHKPGTVSGHPLMGQPRRPGSIKRRETHRETEAHTLSRLPLAESNNPTQSEQRYAHARLARASETTQQEASTRVPDLLSSPLAGRTSWPRPLAGWPSPTTRHTSPPRNGRCGGHSHPRTSHVCMRSITNVYRIKLPNINDPNNINIARFVLPGRLKRTQKSGH